MISNAAFTELRDLLKSDDTERARDLLLSLQAGYFTLMEENRHLQLRVTALEKLLGLNTGFTDKVRVRDKLIWLDTEEGCKGPFCPVCLAADRSLIELEKDGPILICPSCEAEFAFEHEPQRERAVVLPFRKTCKKLGL